MSQHPLPKSRKALAQVVGSRIRKLRLDRGWSEWDLAARLSLPARFIKSYEAGRALPKTHTIYRLGLIFETGAGAFIDEPYHAPRDAKLLSLVARLEALDEEVRTAFAEFLDLFTKNLERLDTFRAGSTRPAHRERRTAASRD